MWISERSFLRRCELIKKDNQPQFVTPKSDRARCIRMRKLIEKIPSTSSARGTEIENKLFPVFSVKHT